MLPLPPRFFVALALVAGASLCHSSARAQSRAANALPPAAPVSASEAALRSVGAAIHYGGAAPLTPQQGDGIFERVAVRPHQQITVALTALPSGDNMVVQAPDGGTLSDHTINAQVNAPAVFAFEAGQHPGVYRVLIHTSAGECELQFLVVDPAHPLPASWNIPQAY